MRLGLHEHPHSAGEESVNVSRASSEILTRLAQAQRPDGGWGAVPGVHSNTEATALGILALARWPDRIGPESLSVGRAWLAEKQNRDGGWPVSEAVPESSWMTSLAVLALFLSRPEGSSRPERAVLRGGLWLLAERGRGEHWLVRLLNRVRPERVEGEPFVVLDFNLIGWPWTTDTFSWVEPTSHAMLALKTLRPFLRARSLDARLVEGRRMIFDRMCLGGGWNYGNSRVLGEELWPYPDTTALALIALHDEPSDTRIRESLASLNRMLEAIDSFLALALSILALRLHGRDVSELQNRLARKIESAGAPADTRSLALSALAMADGVAPFSLSNHA